MNNSMADIIAEQFTAGRQEAATLLNISINVHNLRKRAALSQRALAARTGLPQSRISDIETPLPNSSPGIKVLSKLAAALGVTILDLISPPKANYTQTFTYHINLTTEGN